MQLALPPRVTDRAFARLAEIGAAQPLRVAVEGGGCSGFQYDIKLDDAAPTTTSCWRRTAPGC